MIRMSTLRAALVAVALAFTTVPVMAVPCAGFVDVEHASSFCPNVEWLRNRSITLGCADTQHYCPNDYATRLSMAAFMNRLGNYLPPTFVDSNGKAFAIALDNFSIAAVVASALFRYGGKALFISMMVLNHDTGARGYAPFNLYFELPDCSDAGRAWAPSSAAAATGVVTWDEKLGATGPHWLYVVEPSASSTEPYASRLGGSSYPLGTCENVAGTASGVKPAYRWIDLATLFAPPFTIQ